MGPRRTTRGAPDASTSGDAGVGSNGDGGDGGAIIDVGLGPWVISRTPGVPVPMDDVTVFGFSQFGTAERDPQVMQLAPDMNIRAWQRWDNYGARAADYDFPM